MKIFLGGGAAEILDGNVIDALTDGGGRVQFVLGPQPDCELEVRIRLIGGRCLLHDVPPISQRSSP